MFIKTLASRKNSTTARMTQYKFKKCEYLNYSETVPLEDALATEANPG